jgi:hypothetical protein
MSFSMVHRLSGNMVTSGTDISGLNYIQGWEVNEILYHYSLL